MAGYITHPVLGNAIDQQLNFLEVRETTRRDLRDELEQPQNVVRRLLADPLPGPRLREAEPDLLALGQGDQQLRGLVLPAFPDEVAEMVEGADKAGVEAVVLLGRRLPKP